MATRTEVIALRADIETRTAERDVKRLGRTVQQTNADINRSHKTTQQANEQYSRSFAGLGTSIRGMLGVAGGVAAAGYAIDRMLDRAQNVTNLSQSFDTLGLRIGATTEFMPKLREATLGLVDDMELMKQANNAIILGLPVTEDSMARLSNQAVRLGRAMGIDANRAVESLIVGIGRQSRLWLDNLGIIVDTERAYKDYADTLGVTVSELTDAQKKLAFFEATVRAADTAVMGLSESTDTLGDMWQRTKVRAVNGINDILDAINKIPRIGETIGKDTEEVSEAYLRFARRVANNPFQATDAFARLLRDIADVGDESRRIEQIDQMRLNLAKQQQATQAERLAQIQKEREELERLGSQFQLPGEEDFASLARTFEESLTPDQQARAKLVDAIFGDRNEITFEPMIDTSSIDVSGLTVDLEAVLQSLGIRTAEELQQQVRAIENAFQAAARNLGANLIDEEEFNRIVDELTEKAMELGVSIPSFVTATTDEFIKLDSAVQLFVSGGLPAIREELERINAVGIEPLVQSMQTLLRGELVTSVTRFSSALADAATGAEVEWSSFFKSLMRDLLAAIIRALLLKKILGSSEVGGGGGTGSALSGAAQGAAVGAAFGGFGAIIGGAVGFLGGLEKGGIITADMLKNAHRAKHGMILSGGVGGQDSIPVLAQGGEAVLPREMTALLMSAAQSANQSRMATGQGMTQDINRPAPVAGPTYHVTINALDGKSVRRVLEDNPDAFASALNTASRQGRI